MSGAFASVGFFEYSQATATTLEGLENTLSDDVAATAASATAAAASAAAAASSATTASNDSAGVSASATAATTAAAAALVSENNAASSASAASASATSATTSATTASTGATSASGSASAAATSETNAAASATSATNSATIATAQASLASSYAASINPASLAPINSPQLTGNPQVSDGTNAASIHLSFSNIAQLRAFNPTGPMAGVQVSASVAGYTSSGDGGARTLHWVSSGAISSAADNSVTIFKSTSYSGTGRWFYDASSGIVPEMAGFVGDYSFTTDTGTDNAAAFTALCAAFGQAAYTAGLIGNAGINVWCRGGSAYLLRSIPTFCRYISFIGAAHNQPSYGVNFAEWLTAGSTFVLDVANGATSLTPQHGTIIENVTVARRGLPLAPTGAQCIGFYGTSGGSWNDGSIGINCNGDAGGTCSKGSAVTLHNVRVIGLGKGVYAQAVDLHAFDCIFDCYEGKECTDIGDTVYHHRNKCLPIMGMAVPSGDPNFATARAHAGTGGYYHDRCDGLSAMDEESENWATGLHLSNLSTAAIVRHPGIECNGNAGDIGILIDGWVDQLMIDNPYVGNTQTPISVQAVQWDNATRATWFTEGATGNPSQVDIVGGVLTAGLTGTAVIVIGGDNCHTRISGQAVYPNAADLIHVAALVGGLASKPHVVVERLTVEQAGGTDAIVVDATIAPYVQLDSIWRANPGSWIVPSGNRVPRLGLVGPTSGAWYGPASTALSTITPTAGSLYAFPMPVGSVSKIINLAINVTATTGGSARLGIFADVDGVASGLLYDSGVVSISATGVISPTTAPAVTPVTSPYVWLAVVFGATSTPTVSAIAQSAAANQSTLLGSATSAHAFSDQWTLGYKSGSYSDTTLATALPSTFGSMTASGGPVPAIAVGF